MRFTRVAAATGLSIFLALTGASAAHGYWSDQVQASTSVTAGSIAVSQSGFDQLATTFSSQKDVRAAAITVTNTGTLPATYSLDFTVVSSPQRLVDEVDVRVWPRAGTTCEATSRQRHDASPSSWADVPELVGALDPNQSTVYCVETSPTGTRSHPGRSQTVGTLSVTLTLTSALDNGGWTTTGVPATIVQATTDWTEPTQPGQPTASDTTRTATTLTWAASTDNVGVVAYDLYRVSGPGPKSQIELMRTDVASPYTITDLIPKAHDEFVLTARDAAGNVSVPSESVKVKMTTSCDAPHGNVCLNQADTDTAVGSEASAGAETAGDPESPGDPETPGATAPPVETDAHEESP